MLVSEVPKWRQKSLSGRAAYHICKWSIKRVDKKGIIAKTFEKLTQNLNISVSMNFKQMKQIKVSKFKWVCLEFTKKIRKATVLKFTEYCWVWAKLIHFLNVWLMLYNNWEKSANWIDHIECSKSCLSQREVIMLTAQNWKYQTKISWNKITLKGHHFCPIKFSGISCTTETAPSQCTGL